MSSIMYCWSGVMVCSLTCHQHVWPCSLVNDQLRLCTPCRKGEGRRKDYYARGTRQTRNCRDSGFVQLPKVGRAQDARCFPASLTVVKQETGVYCVCVTDASQGSGRTCRHGLAADLTATRRGTRSLR